MRLRTVLMALAALAALGWPCLAEEGEPDEAEATFRRVFTESIEPVERVRLLEGVAKEHPDSKWADDALWVLGEAARRQGATGRMLCYWQYLLSKWADVKLEDYTRTLEIYRRSLVPTVGLSLVAEGTAFIVGAPEVVTGEELPLYMLKNAERFNAVPMIVWGELAACYARLGRRRLALKAYYKALQAAPEKGRWPRLYRDQIKGMEQQLEAQSPVEAEIKAPEAARRDEPSGPEDEEDAENQSQQENPAAPEEQSVTESAQGD